MRPGPQTTTHATYEGNGSGGPAGWAPGRRHSRDALTEGQRERTAAVHARIARGPTRRQARGEGPLRHARHPREREGGAGATRPAGTRGRVEKQNTRILCGVNGLLPDV